MTAAHIRNAVVLDGATCYHVWRALRDVPRMHPLAQEAKQTMRLVAGAYLAEQNAMSADGHVGRTSADLATGLSHDRSGDYLTAEQMAQRFGRTAHHIRRIARQHEVPPAHPGPPARWDQDAAAVIASRLSAA